MQHQLRDSCSGNTRIIVVSQLYNLDIASLIVLFPPRAEGICQPAADNVCQA